MSSAHSRCAGVGQLRGKAGDCLAAYPERGDAVRDHLIGVWDDSALDRAPPNRIQTSSAVLIGASCAAFATHL
jgi:hypothetical protein